MGNKRYDAMVMDWEGGVFLMADKGDGTFEKVCELEETPELIEDASNEGCDLVIGELKHDAEFGSWSFNSEDLKKRCMEAATKVVDGWMDLYFAAMIYGSDEAEKAFNECFEELLNKKEGEKDGEAC